MKPSQQHSTLIAWRCPTSKSLQNTAILLFALAQTCAAAVKLEYVSTTGSGISFDGAGHFEFQPALGNLLVSYGSAQGFTGEISGLFTIGTVTTTGATN